MENKVVWREGLFIRPQHFQQSDRYYAYELMTRTKELGNNQWGLFNFEIDKELLSTGKISLKEASGILSDGTLFNINGKQGGLCLDIQADDYGKDIFLALPILIPNSDEVHFEEQENILTRYKASNNSDVPNTNAGESSVSDLLIGEFNFKLVLSSDINDGYISIKLGSILSISANGQVFLDEKYLPTYFHLNQCKNMVSKLNEILSMLVFRAEKLAEKLSNSALQTSELGNYLMLQLLNKTETRFHYLLNQDHIHPQEMFLELTTLAGELAVFMKKEKRLKEQFIYNHKDLTISFEHIFLELKEMLSMVLEQNAVSLALEERKYGIYVAQIKDKNLIQNSSFVFSVSADKSSDDIKEVLTNNLKMGSIETIRNLVNYHLAGFKIKPLSTPPREIPYRVNHLYFKIELTSDEKTELERSGGFAFHMATELENVTYALWAIRNV